MNLVTPKASAEHELLFNKTATGQAIRPIAVYLRCLCINCPTV